MGTKALNSQNDLQSSVHYQYYSGPPCIRNHLENRQRCQSS